MRKGYQTQAAVAEYSDGAVMIIDSAWSETMQDCMDDDAWCVLPSDRLIDTIVGRVIHEAQPDWTSYGPRVWWLPGARQSDNRGG